MTIKLEDPKKALFLLKEQVDRMGADFVYNTGGEFTCRYRPITPGEKKATLVQKDEVVLEFNNIEDNRDKTGCIVGEVIKTLIPSEQFKAFVEGNMENSNSLFGILQFNGVLDASYAVQQIMARAQQAQDMGSTWGVALITAIDYYNWLNKDNPLTPKEIEQLTPTPTIPAIPHADDITPLTDNS